MKNLQNTDNLLEVIDRLGKLESNRAPLWGKMNAGEMVCHLGDALAVAFGSIDTQPIGNFLTHSLVKWLSLYVLPIPKGKIQTAKEMQVTPPTDFMEDVEMTVEMINMFDELASDIGRVPHPFFGPLTKQEWGRITYLHFDHHLRQFGV